MTKTNAILLGALLLLFVILGVQHCTIRSYEKEAERARQEEKIKNTTIDSLRNELGQMVTQASLVKTENEELVKDLSQQVFDLKKKDEDHVKAYQALYRVKQRVRIDSVLIPYKYTSDEKIMDSAGLVSVDSVIIPPRSFDDSTQYYTIRGRVLLEGVSLDVVSVPDTVSLRIVEVKKGLFKRRETVVQTIHSNPLVKTEGQQSIIVTPKKSFIEKILPKLALVAGIYLGTKL